MVNDLPKSNQILVSLFSRRILFPPISFTPPWNVRETIWRLIVSGVICRVRGLMSVELLDRPIKGPI